MALVFVYGTLKRGRSNHRLMRGARLLGTHVTEAVFTLLDLGGYPAALARGGTAVSGEVYRIPPGLLARLDRLEGDEYLRVPVPTPWGEAWMYLYRGKRRGRALDSGVWPVAEG